MDQQSLETAKKIIGDLFEIMAHPVEVSVASQDDFSLSVDLKTEEPQILIGQGGETLAEIQHLLKILLKKRLALGQDRFYVDLDINDYKNKKAEYLKELALETANDVSLSKKEKELSPMPAYERRVVHLALAERTDVSSESIGQGQERRVIIRPRP